MGLYDRDYMRSGSDHESGSDPEKGPGRGTIMTIIVIIVLLAIILAFIF